MVNELNLKSMQKTIRLDPIKKLFGSPVSISSMYSKSRQTYQHHVDWSEILNMSWWLTPNEKLARKKTQNRHRPVGASVFIIYKNIILKHSKSIKLYCWLMDIFVVGKVKSEVSTQNIYEIVVGWLYNSTVCF